MDRKALSKALAHTYGGEYDSWERVEEYNDYLEYSSRHPNKGSTALAGALELPRSRIRPWMNGSIPDPVRGIQTAASHGWLDLEWEGNMLRGLTIALSWMFSGGSINQSWVPAFAVERRTRWLAEDVLDQLGVGYTVRHADTEERATELIPAADASVLGRVLVALGAPQGPKADDQLSLPLWLLDAPEPVRLTFAQTYITNRGTTRDDRPQQPVAFREERTAGYRRALRRLFESLVEEQAVSGDSETLYLTPVGAARLNHYPPLKQ
ncbi:hypothetical protein [Salinirussus salinus]|uniref:hypothetical protein n=1 Tax=Salinirussus salinus TaxID=1198300 RepID=UPI001356E9D1|nr:hypothetical protein [Salinirussus salinus]